MKLNGGKAEAFLKSPRDSVRAILFFGPDSGLIRERGKALVSHFADADDPFAVTEVSGDVLKKDGALLSDASNAMSLMGSASVVRVRDLTDTAAPIVESWLDSGAGALPAIFEASELTPRSKIRVLFETRDDAAAIGCYPDEGRDLGAVVREHFSSQGIKLAPDALPALLARLGTDRLAIRQELDKLILYAGGPDSGATVTEDDVEAAIGDIKTSSLDDIAFAVGAGDQKRLSISMDRAFSEGTAAIAVIRGVQRHLDRLHQAKANVENGSSIGEAVKRLRPPVFFKMIDSFISQANVWSTPDLARALTLLLQTERDCKSGLDIDRSLCERTMIQLTQAARRNRRQITN